MHYLRNSTLLIHFVLLLCCNAAPANEPIQFGSDIRPILSDKCFYCHGPDKEHREADLRLDLREDAQAVIKPRDIEGSELIARILAHDETKMPPEESKKSLTQAEIDTLIRWVQEGAEWTDHWSFIAPTKDNNTKTLARHAIDELVITQAGKQTLAPQASKETLIRRATLDLTGLPPTPKEIEAFLQDESSNAFENVIDRLLKSPRFGQRMTLDWLDAARYGDTSVYHADGPRDMWAWRDAVVDAYNANMPFDQFSINQLAGDLIENASDEQKILAGFNRNNGTTDEGGAIAEEYRVEYVVDRVKTTSTVWLGLTMECGQCHDHKYDPISQEDYYRFYAFFNASSDGGMQTRNGNAAPMVQISDPVKDAQLPSKQQLLAETNSAIEQIEQTCEEDLKKWLASQTGEHNALRAYLEQCILRVPLIEGEGDQISATIPTDAKGKIVGKADWVTSRVDWGINFDGTNFVDVGNHGDFERTDAFSYGGWVKPKKGSGQGAVIAKMDNANQFRGYDLLTGTAQVSVHLIHNWPGNAVKVNTKKKLVADQWQHVMMTYDGSSKASGIKIYVNGEQWDWDIEQDGLTETIRTDKTFLIGSRHPGSRFKGEIDEVQVYGRTLSHDEVKQLASTTPISDLLQIAEDQRSEQQNLALKRYFLREQNAEYPKLEAKITSLNQEIEELKKPMTSVMVMGDMANPRETFILNRGAYDSPTEHKVEPGTPSILPPMDSDLPRNRLGLAKWLFQDSNPLTARVTVNRYWQMLFGTGLVSTPEDFGAQGEFPSHPELLDWLATDFRENGWDTKYLIKEIMMSSTYQQSSACTPELYAADPENRTLMRGSRFRLSGESIRDSALMVSGLLIDQYGGPGVKPYQPPGLWAEVGLGGNPKFVQDHGENLYRRSLYTYWKRSAPPPAMQIFDAPTREKCTVRRARTNTPLQALVTLNDVQFVEAARKFGERMILTSAASDIERLQQGFRRVTARLPSEQELDILESLLTDARKKYSADEETAKQLISVGESKPNEQISPPEQAAWTVVASTLLNLDETLTRE